MKPRDFINSLKANHPSPQINAMDIPEQVKIKWTKSGKSLEQLIEILSKRDYAEYLFDRLKHRLSSDLRELFESGFIAVGAVNDSSPNAYMERINDEGYAIIFHSGLRDFIYRVVRALGTRFVPNKSEATTIELIGNEETARLIAEIFWWFQETNSPFGPDYPIHDHQIEIANLIALEAETFLLAHEIGHIIDYGSNHQNYAFTNISPTISFDHQEEYAADIIGLILVLELQNDQAEHDPFKTSLTYAGCEFALQIYKGLETLGFEFKETHPAAKSRIENIRSYMKSRCNNDEVWRGLSSLAKIIEAVFTKLLDIIQDPAENEAYFVRESEHIVSELEELLSQCTGGMFPDYSRFYSEAGKIFNFGYPHKILEKVAQVTGDFFEDVNRFEKDNLPPDHDNWIRFQKYKLLLGFFKEHATEPARSLFLNALK